MATLIAEITCYSVVALLTAIAFGLACQIGKPAKQIADEYDEQAKYFEDHHNG